MSPVKVKKEREGKKMTETTVYSLEQKSVEFSSYSVKDAFDKANKEGYLNSPDTESYTEKTLDNFENALMALFEEENRPSGLVSSGYGATKIINMEETVVAEYLTDKDGEPAEYADEVSIYRDLGFVKNENGTYDFHYNYDVSSILTALLDHHFQGVACNFSERQASEIITYLAQGITSDSPSRETHITAYFVDFEDYNSVALSNGQIAIIYKHDTNGRFDGEIDLYSKDAPKKLQNYFLRYIKSDMLNSFSEDAIEVFSKENKRSGALCSQTDLEEKGNLTPLVRYVEYHDYPSGVEEIYELEECREE